MCCGISSGGAVVSVESSGVIGAGFAAGFLSFVVVLVFGESGLLGLPQSFDLHLGQMFGTIGRAGCHAWEHRWHVIRGRSSCIRFRRGKFLGGTYLTER